MAIRSISPTITLSEPYRIHHKFRDVALVPSEAIDREWYRMILKNAADSILHKNAVFITIDKIQVKLNFTATWNNENKQFNNELNSISQELYGTSFDNLSGYYRKGVGSLSGWWNRVKMERV